MECVHNFNTDEKTTLVKVSKKTMVYPPVEFYFCENCKKFFKKEILKTIFDDKK